MISKLGRNKTCCPATRMGRIFHADAKGPRLSSVLPGAARIFMPNPVPDISTALEKTESRLFSVTGRTSGDVKLILFDFDGTLVDSLPIMKEALVMTFWDLLHPGNTGNAVIGEIEALREHAIFEGFSKKRMVNMLTAMIKESMSHSREAIDVYESVYLPCVNSICERTDFSDKITPGAREYLEYLAGIKPRFPSLKVAISSGGSLGRVHAVAARIGFNLLCDELCGPEGIERLELGGAYKMVTAKRLGKGLLPDKVLAFDDVPGVIRELSRLNYITVGIVHESKDIPEMLNAGSDYILTHDFRAISKTVFSPEISR